MIPCMNKTYDSFHDAIKHAGYHRSIVYTKDGYKVLSHEYPYVDLQGNPVKRTPETHPYSYDAYVTYKSEEFQTTDHWVYDDRMRQWNWDKYHATAETVWPVKTCPHYFDGKKAKDIEKFLSIYFDKKIKLTAIMKGCNVSNGYPYWIFVYREEGSEHGIL